MNDHLLMGLWRTLVPIPHAVWQREVARDAHGTTVRLDFMSDDHHRIRDLAVTDLPRIGAALPPEHFARELDLPLEQVITILDELEQNMTFLFRNKEGAVAWAYPVTVDHTPHHVTFSGGEQVYAAWAIDAIATPFVQGQLRAEPLSFAIKTECAHCGQPLHIEIDSELNYRVEEPGAQPLVFVPRVDLHNLDDPSIIDAFWRNSVFFWSEEHAKEQRKRTGGMRGTYMTLDQAVYVTRPVQGALFAFPRNSGGPDAGE